MKENDFEYITVENGDTEIILLSYNNEEKLLYQAQLSKIKKTKINNKKNSAELKSFLDKRIIEQEKKKIFSIEYKDQYISDSYYDTNYSHIIKDSKKHEDNSENKEDWGFGLFTEAEMLYLELKLLKAIDIDKNVFINLARDNAKLSKKIDNVEKYLTTDNKLISIFTYFKIIIDQTPIHVSNFKNDIMKETLFSLRCPYRKIRCYFGDKVAMYYNYIYHYTRWLVFPALATLLIILIDFFLPDYSKVFLTVYALLLSVWSQIFLIYFQRKCSEIAVEWDNLSEEYDKDNFRREFKGEWRKSPVTGNFEKYFPQKKRIYRILFSIICAIPMLLVSILANICYLNISGFILEDSILGIKFMRDLSLPGGILDEQSIQFNIFSLLFGLLITKINNVYDTIATKTTDWENHRVQSSYDNSLIIKRFMFEFFNYFLSPLYLAFVVFNMEGLRQSMVNK